MPIHVGGRAGHVDIVKLLIDYGASIDSRTTVSTANQQLVLMPSVSEFDSTFHFLLSAFSLKTFVFCFTDFVNHDDFSSLFSLRFHSTINVMSLRRV